MTKKELEERLKLREEDFRLRQAQCQFGASKSVTDQLVNFEIKYGDRLRHLEEKYEMEYEQ